MDQITIILNSVELFGLYQDYCVQQMFFDAQIFKIEPAENVQYQPSDPSPNTVCIC